MTQQQFDLQMNAYRRAESEEKRPVIEELGQLAEKRFYLGQQIAILNAQMAGVKQRIAELQARRKAIGGKYFDLKKELIITNPKKQTTV